MENSQDIASFLHKYGAVAVPVFTDTKSRNSRERWEEEVWLALDQMPEYIKSGKKHVSMALEIGRAP